MLPESHSDFRKGKGCCGMVYVARHLFEKTRGHGDTLFTLLVDLRKAYASVPRQILWQVMEKSGTCSPMDTEHHQIPP